jgi:hypothetical protein
VVPGIDVVDDAWKIVEAIDKGKKREKERKKRRADLWGRNKVDRRRGKC